MLKNNVEKFNQDVSDNGGYGYITDKLSCRLSNQRISQGVASIYDFTNKSILDVGCGDGTFVFEFADLGCKSVLGIDASANAVALCNKKAQEKQLEGRFSFAVGDIYNLNLAQTFDCVVMRSVLHHVSDAKLAIEKLAPYSDTFIIVEPNGYNPVLKYNERFSQYHREHEEQSFTLRTVEKWLTAANASLYDYSYVNLVAAFCPDWLAKICKFFEPFIEKLPLIRKICCGQYVVLANKENIKYAEYNVPHFSENYSMKKSA